MNNQVGAGLGDCDSAPVYGFIVTKPLQLMVAMAIFEQLDDRVVKHILLVDNFACAHEVYLRLRELRHRNWVIHYFAEEKLAYAFSIKSRFDKLFIDSDVGLRQHLTLMKLAVLSPKTVLAVYEEGLGSYRSDLYSGAKAAVLQFFGCGIFFGGNRQTKEFYLFEPQQCTNTVRAKKIKIVCGIARLISANRTLLEATFGSFDDLTKIIQKRNSDDCLIYLTSWTVEDDRIDALCRGVGTVIVKPHPHIKALDAAKWSARCFLAPAGLPAEMIIDSVAAAFDNVTVMHHGSSVGRYLNFPNVKFELVE